MAGRGGARVGAGRKPKSERFGSKIAATEKRIADRLVDVADALLDLAIGVRVQDPDPEEMVDGELRTYQKPPDMKAAAYLLDRIMGKPTLSIEQEISGPDGGPIVIDSPAQTEAAKELDAWRKQQAEQIAIASSSLSAPLTPPTSPTPTA